MTPRARAGRDEETALRSNKETDHQQRGLHSSKTGLYGSCLSLTSTPCRGVPRFQTGPVTATLKRTNDVLQKPDNLKSYRQAKAAPDVRPAELCKQTAHPSPPSPPLQPGPQPFHRFGDIRRGTRIAEADEASSLHRIEIRAGGCGDARFLQQAAGEIEAVAAKA